MQSLFQAIEQAQTEGKRMVKFEDDLGEILIYLNAPTPRTTDMMY